MLIKKDKFVFTIFLISLLTNSLFLTGPLISACEDEIYPNYIGKLTFKTLGGGRWSDFSLLIADYVQDIGIDVNIKMLEWSILVGELTFTKDYDLSIVGIGNRGSDLSTPDVFSRARGFSPDLRDYFTEEGEMNYFGLDAQMPYGNRSEVMLNTALTTSDLAQRVSIFHNWQVNLMDKIVPCLPLFFYRIFTAVWSNIEGFDILWGVTDSLPYIDFDGYHEGQESLEEWNEAGTMWKELNPLLADEEEEISSKIWRRCSEPILQYSPYLAPLKTGLVHDWNQIDDYHYKFYMRDGMYWCPSYNISERTSNSVLLADIQTGELMVGLKGEYSDGSNQKITAKDAVFTYCSWANSNISRNSALYNWISDIYVDPIDPLVFHIHIDANPATVESEMYVDFWSRLSLSILPEFFLNSTNLNVTFTDGGVRNQGIYSDIKKTHVWESYSKSAFGNGKYMLDYCIPNSKTVLRRSPYWFGVGPIDGQTGMTPFVETINIKVFPDVQTELADFKAGKLDFFEKYHLFPAERKQMQANTRFIVDTSTIPYFDCLAFNLKRPLIGGEDNFVWLTGVGKEEYTKATAVRKAICYSIDREEINQIIGDGEWAICHDVLSPFIPLIFYDYNEFPIKYYRDLEIARDWLDVGWYHPPPIPVHRRIFLRIVVPILLSTMLITTVFIIIRRKRKN